MVEPPTISVVINNHNYAAYVGQAIESVLAQRGVSVECIVVDDGSTDNSRAVISAYPGIKRVFKANGGQLSAVRAGLAEVTSEIVVCLDSDDVLYPDACRDIVGAWHPGLSLLQYGLDKIDGAGAIIGAYPNEPFLARDHLSFLLKYGYIPSSPMSGNAFSRKYLESVLSAGSIAKGMAADGYLIYCAPLYGQIGKYEANLGCYRVHGRNASTSSGVNARSVQRQLLHDIKFREGLAHNIKSCGLPAVSPLRYLGPYDFRAILLLNKGHRDISRVTHVGYPFAVTQAIEKFLGYPGIPLWNRVKNVMAVLAIAALPPAFARRFLPDDFSGSIRNSELELVARHADGQRD